MFWWILIIVFIGIYVFYLIVNMIYDYDYIKHYPSKYCNHCDMRFSYENTYCPECGRTLDEEYVMDADLGDKLRTHILAYKNLFKKRDIVYFEDYDCNYIDISICLLNKEDRRYLKELQNNEKFLNMIVKKHTIKRVRDGFMKSHLEHTIIYSSGDKKNIYDDCALERSNGGINND